MTAAFGGLEAAAWGILTFSILVVLHELGHFLAARSFGVKIHEFMLGLPGPALRFKTKNMTWGVTAIPLGGYVRIAGMEPGDEDELLADALAAVRDGGIAGAESLARRIGVDEARADALLLTLIDWKAIEEREDGTAVLTVEGETHGLSGRALLDRARTTTYRGQSTWRRIAILAAGVVTNLALAILVFTVVLSIWGYYEFTPQITAVAPDTPAAEAGIEPGETVVGFNGTEVERWEHFLQMLATTDAGDTVTIDLERDGTIRTVELTLAERDGHGYVGVSPTFVEVYPTVLESLGESFRMTGEVFRSIVRLFDPRTFTTTVRGVRSVIGVSVMAAEAAAAGPLSYAGLVAMLSLSLGVLNILPLPPLDGGKIALELIERVLGRPLNRTLTLGLNTVGALLLFSLIGYIMFADIARLIG